MSRTVSWMPNDLSYSYLGALDFQCSELHVSLPVFSRAGSNHTYIPKTNNQFDIVDFYEVSELLFGVIYDGRTQTVRQSSKCPLPVFENGAITIVDSGSPVQELSFLYPNLSSAAIKLVTSLIQRVNAMSSPARKDKDWQDILNAPPVRSKLWISRYKSATQHASINSRAQNEILWSKQKEWIEKFANKSSAKMVDSLLKAEPIALEPNVTREVHARRLVALTERLGFKIGRTDFDRFEKLFPHSLMNSIVIDQKTSRYSSLPEHQKVWKKPLSSGDIHKTGFMLRDAYQRIGTDLRITDPTNALYGHSERLNTYHAKRVYRLVNLLLGDHDGLRPLMDAINDDIDIAIECLSQIAPPSGTYREDGFHYVYRSHISELIKFDFAKRYFAHNYWDPAVNKALQTMSDEFQRSLFFERVYEVYEAAMILKQTANPNLRSVPLQQIIDGRISYDVIRAIENVSAAR